METQGKHIRVTDKTLAGQLQITDREIAHRRALLSLTDADVRELAACREHIVQNIDHIVSQFYEIQLEVPEISLLIGDAETLQRLRSSMRRYILELFEGFYGSEYVNKRLRIGKVHKRIGVSPKLYIAAISLLEQHIEKFLATDPAVGDDREMLDRRRNAVRKLLMFDIQLVFDTYISSLVAEVESAKVEMENYAASLEETIEERTRQLKELSTRDALTGLFNQRAFNEHLSREIAVAERSHEPIALLYMDLNGFKALNDRDGHRSGDKVLSEVGFVLQKSVRESDLVCRYGGDEFCVIMPRTDEADARIVCDRIVTAFGANGSAGIMFSAGVAISKPEAPMDADTLVRTADRYMYEAKERSRDRAGIQVQIQPNEPPKVQQVS